MLAALQRREAQIRTASVVFGQANVDGPRLPADLAAAGPSESVPVRRGSAKSFVDDLALSRGIVPSRAVTSLRSIEI